MTKPAVTNEIIIYYLNNQKIIIQKKNYKRDKNKFIFWFIVYWFIYLFTPKQDNLCILQINKMFT